MTWRSNTKKLSYFYETYIGLNLLNIDMLVNLKRDQN